MSTKNLVATAAIALAALVGGFGVAEAHGMGNGMGKSMGMNMGKGMNSGMDHHDFFRHHGVPIIVGTSYSDCGYLFDKWQLTGSLYWKSQFLECKYGS